LQLKFAIGFANKCKMLNSFIDDLTLADFKLSWSLVIDFNSTLGLLHNVVLIDNTNISEVYAVSIFRVRVHWLASCCVYIQIYKTEFCYLNGIVKGGAKWVTAPCLGQWEHWSPKCCTNHQFSGPKKCVSVVERLLMNFLGPEKGCLHKFNQSTITTG
jgi:hypothetical protein